MKKYLLLYAVSLVLAVCFFTAWSDTHSVAADSSASGTIITHPVSQGGISYTLRIKNDADISTKTIKALCNHFEAVYPDLCEEFNHDAPKKITYRIYSSSKVSIKAGRSTLYITSAWVERYKNDLDALLYKLMKPVLAYNTTEPLWLIRGIKAYGQYKYASAASAYARLREPGAGASYTDSSRTAAAFLVWIEENYSDSLTDSINEKLKNGTYTQKVWKKCTGMSLTKLWNTYMDSFVRTVSLVAVGDNLLHQSIIDTGKRDDGTYNYDHLYSNMKKYIEAADLAVINQETILGGSAFAYTGYPCFNSPQELGDAVIAAGFDVVLQASNHSLDYGNNGLKATLKYWAAHPDITLLGANRSEEEYNTVQIIERNGIKLALLNYTYGVNGNRINDSNKYMLDTLDKDKIKKDLKTARDQADFIIVFPHWGTEYVYKPDSSQLKWAEFFCEEGVDLIIGTHPHVLQSIETLTAPDGHKMLCYYSLGNYVSNMDYVDRLLGGMANVTIVKDKSGVYLKDASLTPLVAHLCWSDATYATVYTLEDYTDTLAAKHRMNKSYGAGTFTVDRLHDIAVQILGKWCPN